MGDSDEIKPGDRFECVGDFCGPRGTVVTASRPWGWSGLWAVLEGATLRRLADPNLWRRLPRADAPAVKVGDVVRDPALLQVGMRVKELASGWEATLLRGTVPNRPDHHWRADSSGPGHVGVVEAIWHSSIREIGVRIIALPEPPKAEVQCRRDPDCVRVDGHTTMCTTETNRPPLPPKAEPVQMLPLSPEKIQQAREALRTIACGGCFEETGHKRGCPRVAPPPPRCEPGCTPKEPCYVDEGGHACPGFSELGIGDAMKKAGARGVSPELPPARASTYQPRCAELAGYGSWNGRAGK